MNGRGWHVVGASVRGDSHRRNGAPNQDAVGLLPGAEGPTIVAVSDGHGSPSSFRSDVGSAIAIRVGTTATRSFFAELGEEELPSGELERRAMKTLVPEIVSRWTEAVTGDIGERPFTDEEIKRARERGGSSDPLVEPLVVYGATLVLAATSGSVLLLLQIGDGDVLTVGGRGAGAGAASRPVPRDSRLVGNETTSLCLPDAVNDFRVRAIDLRSSDAPGLVVVSTDGYANSFVNEDAFVQAGPDIMKMIRERGLDWVGEHLSGWLEGASKHGSGDDITMGLLVRGTPSAPGKAAEDPSAGAAATRGLQPAPAAASSLVTRRTGVMVAIALVAGGIVGWLIGGNRSPAPAPPSTVSVTPSSTPPVVEDSEWVWVGNGTLVELSGGKPAPGLIHLTELDGKTVIDTAFGFDTIWVATADGILFAVDPATKTAQAVELPSPASQIVIGKRDASLTSLDGKTYYLVDPQDLTVRKTKVLVPGSPA